MAAIVSLGFAAAPPADLHRLRADVARKPADAAARFALGQALALEEKEKKDEALGHLEAAIALDPGSLRYGNEYRKACVKAQECQRAIDFLEKQTAAHPDSAALHLNLAMAYVDKMPTAGLGIVGQGLLSNRSIGELDKVLVKDPKSWPATYGRAMNHLHWPKVLKHAARAAADFEACLRLQETIPASGRKPHHLLPYLGLGDAFVKNDQITEARRAWKEAGALFPGDPRLVKRQALGDEELKRFVEDERGLARPIDTDLSFVWAP
jgi:tetratricopeptide (TPR) repeat protein